MNNFPTQMHEIISLVDKINPVDYAKTRNYSSGHISRLGPYISRGVITPRWIYHRIRTQGYSAKECFKFLQELTWREYYQGCWEALGDKLFDDLKPFGILEFVRSGRVAINKPMKTLSSVVEQLEKLKKN